MSENLHQKHIDNLQKEIEAIKNSLSYKVGFTLTSPLRFFHDKLNKKGTENKKSNVTPLKFDKDFSVSIDNAYITTGELIIEGWVVASGSDLESIEIYYKNELFGKAKIGIARPDVVVAIGSEAAAYSGFSFEQIWNGETKPEIKIVFKNQKGTKLEQTVQLTKAPMVFPLLSDALSQFSPSPIVEQEQLKFSKPIDLIVPVYNGFQYLKPLFDSILKNTKTPYRLIVVNDKSPDEKVLPYLKKRQADFKDFILLENEENLGFVKSVNKAFELIENHFVLVNTDVEVPPNWLERLVRPIIENPKEIASVTPFTNSGTICSFPKFLKDNPIIDQLSVNEVDLVFQQVRAKNNYEELPTGIGFCMAFNKKLTDKIGMFDAETFGKGYGEENDWCMRAIEKGYRNTIASNLFVYHKHGGSFDKKEKETLNLRNSKKLSEKHPNYSELVGEYCAKDPSKKIRDFAIFLLAMKNQTGKKIFVIDHNIGGGTNIYRNEYIEKEVDKGNTVIVLQHQADHPNLFIEFYSEKHQVGFEIRETTEIQNLFSKFYPLDEIFVNNLVSYANPIKLVKWVIELKELFKCKLVIPTHDYYAICPSYNLLNKKFDFCGVPDNMYECQNCLKYVNYVPIQSTDILEWREEWGKLLELGEEILCFSNASADLLLRAYPTVKEKVTVIPHTIKKLEKPKIEKKEKQFTIGLLGGISRTKGSDILKDMLDKMFGSEIINTNVVVVGSVGDPRLARPYKNFHYTGPYKREELVSIVEKYQIDIFFIPSVWPETFSYTSQEIMEMELPLAVFDMGAPAERVKKYDKGLIIDKVDGGYALEKIWEWFVAKDKENSFVYEQPKSPIIASLDTANRVHDKIAIWGWAYSPYGIEKIKLFIKGQFIGEAFYSYPRKDLLASFDQFEEMVDTGFFFNGIDKTFNSTAPGSSIEVEIIDKRGYKSYLIGDFQPTPHNQYQALYNLPMDSQYDIYLAKLLANNNQKKMIVDGPMISIFGIVTEDFHVDSFMETLESVKGQTYNNWELILMAPSFYKEEIEMATAKVANYQNVQISVQYGMRFFEQGESEYAKEINAAKGSVIGFVNINDEYPSNAFCEIAEFFQENENCEFVYTDEDYVGLNGERILPHFKTDFSLDLLYSSNFLKNAFFIKKNLLEKAGGLNFEYKNGILFDLILRLQESKTTFYHLPKILYSKRNWKTQQNHNLLIEKKYYNEMAILDHFKRRNLEVELIEGAKENTYRTKFLMKEKPLVSIIIPFKDQIDLLKVCVNSLLSKTSYANYELLLISNNSKEEITFNYLDSVKEDNSNVQYFEYNVPFNYSKINNWAAKKANGKYLLFLNNDTEIVEKDWLSSMMEHMQREEVGAVGARLLYEHNSLQHDGVVYGICDMAEHAFRTYPSSDNSRHPDMGLVRNVSVATAACLLMKRKLFEEIGGFDEKNLTVAYNDVDLCMELSKKGYLIVQTPYALMYHYESKSRGYEDTSEKYKRFMKEQSFMRNKWKKELIKGDPFYSPNLSKVYNDYSLDI